MLWKANRFGGGDIVTGAATVILAMGAGRTAAQAIHEHLMNGKKEPRFCRAPLRTSDTR
jgi:glutamate synthase (NADPH/NADH) small chain